MRLGSQRVLGQRPRPAAAARDAADLGPACGRVSRAIDARAGGRVNGARRAPIERDREDVGIVDHARVDEPPGLAAVERLPRQMPGADIGDLGVHGIDRDGLDIAQLRMAGGREASPRIAAIVGAEDARDRAGHENIGVRRGDGQRSDRFPGDAPEQFEAPAVVLAAGDTAALPLYFPVADEDAAARIDADVVEALAALRKARQEPAPRLARVRGAIQEAVRRTEKQDLRIARIARQRAHVAAGRPRRRPSLRRRRQDESQQECEAGGSLHPSQFS